jgi:hypothetical protein
MIADSTKFIERAPHAIVPVFALIILTLSISVVGGHLRRWLDPVRAVTEEPATAREVHSQLALTPQAAP